MNRWIYIAGAVAIAIALATSGNNNRKGPRAPDPEELLFRDPERAGPEIDRRLAESVRVQDGLLLLKDPILGDLDVAVMPAATASWILHCGIGVTLAFGGGASEAVEQEVDDGVYEAGSTSFAVELTLSTALLDAKTCAVIAPMIGKRIRALLRAAETPPTR